MLIAHAIVALLVACAVCNATVPLYQVDVTSPGAFTYQTPGFTVSADGTLAVADNGHGTVYTYNASSPAYPAPVATNTSRTHWVAPYALSFDGTFLLHGDGTWLSVARSVAGVWTDVQSLAFPSGLAITTLDPQTAWIDSVSSSASSALFAVSVLYTPPTAPSTSPKRRGHVVVYAFDPGSTSFVVRGVLPDAILNTQLAAIATGNYTFAAALSGDGHVMAVGQLSPGTYQPCFSVFADSQHTTGAAAIATVAGPFPNLLGSICFAVGPNTNNYDYLYRLVLDTNGAHGTVLAYVDPYVFPSVIQSSLFTTFVYGRNPSTLTNAYYRDSLSLSSFSTTATELLMASNASSFVLLTNQPISARTFLSRSGSGSTTFVIDTVPFATGVSRAGASRNLTVLGVTNVVTQPDQTDTAFRLEGTSVACVYSGTYGSFNACSVSCGGGMQYATQALVSVARFGGSCDSVPTRNRTCAVNPCPVDCVVSAWGPLSPCSAPCGTGQIGSQFRYRTILVNASNGGAACPPLSQGPLLCESVNCGGGESGGGGDGSGGSGGGQSPGEDSSLLFWQSRPLPTPAPDLPPSIPVEAHPVVYDRSIPGITITSFAGVAVCAFMSVFLYNRRHMWCRGYTAVPTSGS
jgi:hypothetical protein